ncbi:MAG: Ig-like domain-containing protein [Bacteroidetes bacterium]|nr:Ig-like domain-containing protein [Bacteroidota bacterium]
MGKIAKQLILIMLTFLLINSCANQLPPGGGEVDKIPPEIVEVYPSNGTINYDDNYFEIEFSEYVDKRSFKDALFISPNIEGRLIYEWTGTGISVEFAEGLKEDVTYTITVGTDLVDRNNKNRMESSFTFSFSTGSTIDRRTISGRVYSDDQEGVLIYTYKMNEGVDTLFKRKPDYVSQTGNDGSFKLNGLGESNYRLFAIKDEYRDLIYDLNLDLIGLPNQDISLQGLDTSFTGIYFKLFKADTTAPRLLKGIMTDERHILVTVTEKIDNDLLTSDNFYVIDSMTNKKSAISFVFSKQGKFDEIVLVPEVKLESDNDVFLMAKMLKDTVDNEYKNDFVQLTVSDRPDTIPVNVTTSEPKNNAIVDFINPNIKFYFNDGFRKEDIQRNITFTDTLNKRVPFQISYDDDATLVVSPLKELIAEKDYIINLDLNAFVDAAGNKQDSIYEFKFKTISGLDFTGITGKILNVHFHKNPVLVLENIDNKKLKYQTKVSEENFNFERVEAGKYILWCYFDEDSNYQYSYGWPEPIKFSERFFIYSDTLKLKPRWVITDVLFEFK